MTDRISPGHAPHPRPDETDPFTVADESDLDEPAIDPDVTDAFERFLRRGTPLPAGWLEATGPDEGFEPVGAGQRARRLAVRTLRGLLWLGAVGVVAFGSAGIVGAAERPPATGSRPELTWAADQSFAATLDEAVKDVESISAEVDALAALARDARGSLTQQNRVALEAAVGDATTVRLAWPPESIVEL